MAQVSGNLGLTVIPLKSEVPYGSVKCILFNPRTCICKVTRLESDGSSKVLVGTHRAWTKKRCGWINEFYGKNFPFNLYR